MCSVQSPALFFLISPFVPLTQTAIYMLPFVKRNPEIECTKLQNPPSVTYNLKIFFSPCSFEYLEKHSTVFHSSTWNLSSDFWWLLNVNNRYQAAIATLIYLTNTAMNPSVAHSHINTAAVYVILLLELSISAGRLLFTRAATGGSQLCLHCGLM